MPPFQGSKKRGGRDRQARPPDRRHRQPFGEHNYTAAEEEVLRAVAAWKAKTGRRFPSITEVFAVIIALGYRKEETP